MTSLALTRLALEFRQSAGELLLASRNALANAEALEEVICNGTDEEKKEALRLALAPTPSRLQGT